MTETTIAEKDRCIDNDMNGGDMCSKLEVEFIFAVIYEI